MTADGWEDDAKTGAQKKERAWKEAMMLLITLFRGNEVLIGVEKLLPSYAAASLHLSKLGLVFANDGYTDKITPAGKAAAKSILEYKPGARRAKKVCNHKTMSVDLDPDNPKWDKGYRRQCLSCRVLLKDKIEWC